MAAKAAQDVAEQQPVHKLRQRAAELFPSDNIDLDKEKTGKETTEKRGLKKYWKPVVAGVLAAASIPLIYFGLIKGKDNTMSPEKYNAMVNKDNQSKIVHKIDQHEVKDSKNTKYTATLSDPPEPGSWDDLEKQDLSSFKYSFRDPEMSVYNLDPELKEYVDELAEAYAGKDVNKLMEMQSIYSILHVFSLRSLNIASLPSKDKISEKIPHISNQVYKFLSGEIDESGFDKEPLIEFARKILPNIINKDFEEVNRELLVEDISGSAYNVLKADYGEHIANELKERYGNLKLYNFRFRNSEKGFQVLDLGSDYALLKTI